MENIAWYNHIELAGAFLILVFVAGNMIKLFLERWISKPPCASCVALMKIPTIEGRQSIHREVEHLQLATDITEIKGNIVLVLEKIGNVEKLVSR